MISRRNFLGASAATLAGATATPTCIEAQAQQGEDDLPPSILALTSMKDEATPITLEERRQRIEKARRLMRANDLDAILLIGGTSLVYYANVSWWNSERLFALILPVEGRPFVVTPAFEEDRTREQLDTGPLAGDDVDVLTWHEDDDPYRLVAQGLRERGRSTGRLGIEETVRFVFSHGVAQAAPSLQLASATPVTAGCRGVKTAHELALMRLASKVTLKAYDAAWRGLKDGMTQQRFAELVAAAHDRLGFSGGAGVQVGEYSALPHGSSAPQVIREGTILLIDGGCGVEGYRSDISRTFVLGQPTEKMKRVFQIAVRAQTAALRAAAPGVPCEAVDRAARTVIEEAGFGPDYAFFTHRVGHGIGMDGHEWPYLVRGNTQPLEPGMTFSDEPGIYIPGEFGVRLEDDMVITEDGAELMTLQSRSLEEPFGG
ncbi:MAG: Xaa-Pro peptidase family protein [Gemmatimonadota bacterium]|nr:Xaa-Pro peptidase family protein [Gemmatimonadota bacterium]MDH3368536.1 Xaa-Pro peptidase family protein [Gemmatimonadota bacterium]MDH3479116.1 Xaa-Pro peptidase family protein [Gemmatimonadota bacterium]MDH3570212.1 Xaa-Pro peptidase family protein [Gemmatimonadota bacterium]MDH5551039.1 Xaa-Pro peptidase family protein [Gemmatimonadota bacterium]